MDTKTIGRVRAAAVLAWDWHDSCPWGQNYDRESRTKTCTCRVTFSAICAKNNANKQTQDEQSGKCAKYELMSPHRRAKNLKQTQYIILAGVDEKCKTFGSCELMQHHYKRSLRKIGTRSGAGHICKTSKAQII